MAVINDASQAGNLAATNLTLSNSAQVGSATFANLGTAANGSDSLLLELHRDHRVRGGRLRRDGHVCERRMVLRGRRRR